MIDGQELSKALGIPYKTIWRRARANEIPCHWVKQHALDKRPRMMFRLDEVLAALPKVDGETANAS